MVSTDKCVFHFPFVFVSAIRVHNWIPWNIICILLSTFCCACCRVPYTPPGSANKFQACGKFSYSKNVSKYTNRHMAQTLFTSVPFHVIIVVVSYEMYYVSLRKCTRVGNVIWKKNKQLDSKQLPSFTTCKIVVNNYYGKPIHV